MLDKMQSEQINELASALSKAQGEMTPAIKDSKNPFFKSSYADLSSIWNSCKEPLSKHGLAVVQTMDTQEGQFVLLTTLAHSSGQWMRSCLPILTEKNTAQGLGSSITYMRRYALSAIVGITCDEDDDGHEASKPKASNKVDFIDSVTKAQMQELQKMLDQCDDLYVENVTNYYAKMGVNEWTQLSKEQYHKLYDNVSNKLKGKAI
jgi:hypothetical protein